MCAAVEVSRCMNQHRDAIQRACLEFTRLLRTSSGAVDEVLAKGLAASYVEEALHHDDYLIDEGVDPVFLAHAIRYLAHTQAMPPLEGNLQWFAGALDALVELACPNAIVQRDEEPFFTAIKRGIESARSRYQNEA